MHVPRLCRRSAKALHDGVRETLEDVAPAVGDFQSMRQRMLRLRRRAGGGEDQRAARRSDEAVELLRWLAADKFTFLGARDYEYARDGRRATSRTSR